MTRQASGMNELVPKPWKDIRVESFRSKCIFKIIYKDSSSLGDFMNEEAASAGGFIC